MQSPSDPPIPDPPSLVASNPPKAGLGSGDTVPRPANSLPLYSPPWSRSLPSVEAPLPDGSAT